jgi:hypothetical protein
MESQLNLFLFINLLTYVWAEPVYVKTSSITDVRILGNTAEIQREFVANNVNSGYNTVILQHLPHSVDEQSIRVKGKGDTAITLLSTMVRDNVVGRNDDDVYTLCMEKLSLVKKRILDELNQYSTEYSQLDIRLRTIEKYVQSYLDNRDSSSATADSRLSPEKMIEILNFQDKEVAVCNKALLSLKVSMNATNAALIIVNQAIGALSTHGVYAPLTCKDLYPHSSGPSTAAVCEALPNIIEAQYWPESKSEKELHLKLHVPSSDTHTTSGKSGSSNIVFTLTHLAHTASWRPEYDVHLEGSATADRKDSNGYSLQIDFFAAVTQNTG